MEEELIISGRMNPRVDPVLNIWHWEIPVDLFAGGIAAGILFFAGYYYLQNKENEYPAAVKRAPLVAPIMIIVCLIALFLDLSHKPYFWRLYTTFRIESPMSWGSWTFMVITPLAFVWAGIHIREVYPKWDWRLKWLNALEDFFKRYKKVLAWMMVIFSTLLGIYAGVLLSAFNARPLWNTSILGPLFLVAALLAGASVILAMARKEKERKLFGKIILSLIVVELFFIIHMFMGFLASTEVQIEAAQLFLGGSYTLPFWIFVVFLGLIVPGLLEILQLRGQHIPVLIPTVLILFGNIMMRFIIVYAGQASRYLY